VEDEYPHVEAEQDDAAPAPRFLQVIEPPHVEALSRSLRIAEPHHGGGRQSPPSVHEQAEHHCPSASRSRPATRRPSIRAPEPLVLGGGLTQAQSDQDPLGRGVRQSPQCADDPGQNDVNEASSSVHRAFLPVPALVS
jgi:hypothetical protein